MKRRRFVASLAAIGLTLLGFGSCRTPKSVVDGDKGESSVVGIPDDPRSDSTVMDPGRSRIERPIKLMYGVRPRQFKD